MLLWQCRGLEFRQRRAAGDAGRDARRAEHAARPRGAAAHPAALSAEGRAVAPAVRARSRPDEVRRISQALVDVARQFDREACRNSGRGRRTGHRAAHRPALSLSRREMAREGRHVLGAAQGAWPSDRAARARRHPRARAGGRPRLHHRHVHAGSGHVDQSLSAGHRHRGGFCPARRTDRSRPRRGDRGRGRSRARGSRRERRLMRAIMR